MGGEMLLAGFLDAIIAEFFGEFTDSTVYFTMAMVGTLFFLLRMVTLLFGGGDGTDFDLDHADGVEGHHGGFSFFSLLSILSFLMGAGWLGLACRREWGLSPVVSALSSSGFGFLLMTFSSLAMYHMRRMNQAGSYDAKNCIGSIGRIYLKVPPKGQGRGQIEVTVDGRRKVLPAVSASTEIASFAAARVVGVQEGETLIVEPAQ
jgi:hypothetical protein